VPPPARSPAARGGRLGRRPAAWLGGGSLLRRQHLLRLRRAAAV